MVDSGRGQNGQNVQKSDDVIYGLSPYLDGSFQVQNGVIVIVHDKLDKNWGKIDDPYVSNRGREFKILEKNLML